MAVKLSLSRNKDKSREYNMMDQYLRCTDPTKVRSTCTPDVEDDRMSWPQLRRISAFSGAVGVADYFSKHCRGKSLNS